MRGRIVESHVESAALGWFEANGWHIAHSPDSGELRVKDAERFLEERGL